MNLFAFESLSADLPVETPNDDELNYAPFAQHLAASIPHVHASKGFVIAINGEWGLGKSTVIAFLRYYLSQLDEAKQPLIVDFSPWMFSSAEDLVRRFLDQLLIKLTTDPLWKSVGKKLKKPISAFANALADAPAIGGVAKTVQKVVDEKPRDLFALKESISKLLNEEDRKIVVFIDDIDRLASEEIRHIFRLVKAVANFPNVIYILAYDKNIVAKALNTEGASGEAYLEKIVQVSYDLPLPGRVRLNEMFFKKLNALIADVSEELFDQAYWTEMYFFGLEHFITTPRHVIRLINALTLTYTKIQNEVNSVDFVALETLRLFCPSVYDIIRKNKEEFTRSSSPMSSRVISKKQEAEQFHDAYLQAISEPNRAKIKKTLMLLFPMLSDVFGGHGYSGYFSLWRKQLRVCVPDMFDLYFQHTLTEENISLAEIKVFISLTEDAESFAQRLVELSNRKLSSGKSAVRGYLERLFDYIERDIPSSSIPSILQAFFSVGDQLILASDERQAVFDFGIDGSMSSIILLLSDRLPEPERFEVLKTSIIQGKAISFIVREVTSFGQQYDRFSYGHSNSSGTQILTLEHVIELEQVAVEKIRQAVANETLLESPYFGSILFRWVDWGTPDEVKNWIAHVSKTDSNLIAFLEKMLGKIHSSSGHRNWIEYTMNLKAWIALLDADNLIDRVRQLVNRDDLTDQQKTALGLFITEYEDIQKNSAPDNLNP